MESGAGSKKLKILIVEDSDKILQTISNYFTSSGRSDVVEITHNIDSAYSTMVKIKPDIVILSADFPGISVHHFLEKIFVNGPLPVIMLSSHSLKSKFITLQALEKGAVNFVVKPSLFIEETLANMMNELDRKVIYHSSVFLHPDEMGEHSGLNLAISNGAKILSKISLIIITFKNSRLKYVSNLISSLPPDSPCIILLHDLPFGFSKTFAGRLNEKSSLNVKEAENGENLSRGKVIVALPDFHLRLNNSNNEIVIENYTGEKVNGMRPSADLLMFSAAEHLNDKVLAIKLGRSDDGIDGLKLLRRNSCLTFCEEIKGIDSSIDIYPGDINYYQPLPQLAASLRKIILSDTD